ncbi:MAG: cyclic nucleotide-binding domain-containing protein [Anaerolineae bacterium]|nr:cyclic nucleotide-binding domain-containing protein [Anaerolineae bacterium]
MMGNASLDENLLRNVPLFSGLDAAELHAWARCGQLVHYHAGEQLFAKGDASSAFYLIQEGWVRLTPDLEGAPLATLGPGSLVGETEFFQGVHHSLCAIANTPVQVWVFEQDAVQAVIDQNQAIGLKLGLALGIGIMHYRRHLLERLGRLPFLRMLESEEQRRAVVERLAPHSYRANEVLYRSGDAPSGIYIVESGMVRLIDDNGETAEVRPGEALGVLSVLAGKPHPETAQAITPTVVWHLGPTEFARLADTYPRLRSMLGRNLRAPLSAADRVRAVEMLKRMPLFTDIERVHLDTVAACLVLRYVPAGDVLFAPGDPGDAMYFIETGQIEILSTESDDTPHILARLIPGDYFGEMALLTGKSRTVMARAARHTSLWALYRADFDALLVKLPVLMTALSRALRERLSQAAETALPTYLHPLAFSSGLSRVELSALNEKLEAQSFRRGEVVCTEGQLGDRMYFVASGQVELSVGTPQGRKVLRILGEGDFFGEIALLTGQPYKATARMTADGMLWVLRKSDFDTLLFKYPNLAAALSRMRDEHQGEVVRKPDGTPQPASVSPGRAGASASSVRAPKAPASEVSRPVPSSSPCGTATQPPLPRPAPAGPARGATAQPPPPHLASVRSSHQPITQSPTPTPATPLSQVPGGPSGVPTQRWPGRPAQRPSVAPDTVQTASALPREATRTAAQPSSRDPAKVRASVVRSPAAPSPERAPATPISPEAKRSASPQSPGVPDSRSVEVVRSLETQQRSTATMAGEAPPSHSANVPSQGAVRSLASTARLLRQPKVERTSRHERIRTSRLGKFIGAAAVWFTTRSRRVKVGLLLLLLLFVWLCMVTLPSMLIHELSANLNGGDGAVGQAYARNGGEGGGISDTLLQSAPAQGVAAVLPFLETVTPTPTHTPTPTDTPTITPTPTGTLLPTWTPTPTITPTPTRTPSPTPPPATPTPRPRVRATRAPTDTPTPLPTPTPDVDYIITSVRQLTPCENEGKHHIFVHVIDQFGNGIDGVPIKICWGPSDKDCARPLTETKSRGKGWVEFAMFKGTYNVRVDGAKSMVASGITPDYQLDEMCPETGNPVANSRYHASFEVIFQKIR